jgi:hypothetical protein
MSTENTNNNASQKQTEGVKQTKKNTTRYRPRVKKSETSKVNKKTAYIEKEK